MCSEQILIIQRELKEKYGHECTYHEAKIAGPRLLELFRQLEITVSLGSIEKST